MKKNILQILFILILVIIILSQLMGIKPFKKLVYQSCQPAEFKYDNFKPYCLDIYRDSGLIDREYVIEIDNESGYIYTISYPSIYVSSEKSEFKDQKVEWSENGVKLYRKNSQAYIFVPAEEFAASR